MRQPNENWLKYMLLSGFKRGHIVDSAKLHGMVIPSSAYLSTLKDGMSPPKNFDHTKPTTRRWLRRNKLYALFADGKYMCEAREILGCAKSREVAQLLITAKTGSEDIAFYIRELVGKSYCTQSIEMFEHCYWNLSLLTSTELLAHFSKHPEEELLTGTWNTGTDYALWKLGYRVEMSKEDLLKGMIHEASMRFFETTQKNNNQSTANTARMWSEVVFKGMEEQSRGGEELREIIEKLKSVSVKLNERDIKSVEDLTKGLLTDKSRKKEE